VIPRLALAATLALATVGAWFAWHRVASTANVNSQLSPAIAAGFGALTIIGFAAVVAAGYASRQAASRDRKARTETIMLATTAVEAMLRRYQ
jgi:hypothetical protein